jgi:hypothetical protein
MKFSFVSQSAPTKMPKRGSTTKLLSKHTFLKLKTKLLEKNQVPFLFFNQVFLIGKDRDEIMAVLSFLLEFGGNTRQDASGKGPQARVTPGEIAVPV